MVSVFSPWCHEVGREERRRRKASPRPFHGITSELRRNRGGLGFGNVQDRRGVVVQWWSVDRLHGCHVGATLHLAGCRWVSSVCEANAITVTPLCCLSGTVLLRSVSSSFLSGEAAWGARSRSFGSCVSAHCGPCGVIRCVVCLENFDGRTRRTEIQHAGGLL